MLRREASSLQKTLAVHLGHRDLRVRHAIARDRDRALGRIDDEGHRAGGVPRRVEDAHSGLDLIAVLDLREVRDRVEHRARPARRRPVVGVGVARVPALPLVDQHLGGIEHVVVLRVVPVRVRHHGDVDVGRPQVSLRQRLEQRAPPADVPRVHDDAAVAAHQQGTAVADGAVVRGDGLSVQQDLNRGHHCLLLCGGGGQSKISTAPGFWNLAPHLTSAEGTESGILISLLWGVSQAVACFSRARHQDFIVFKVRSATHRIPLYLGLAAIDAIYRRGRATQAYVQHSECERDDVSSRCHILAGPATRRTLSISRTACGDCAAGPAPSPPRPVVRRT